ncbi:MAG: aldose 1-epimerase family protein, partial [Clostridia bacterium]|nr:aldose 1-epimerase family protein [Clostridia bacterium]
MIYSIENETYRVSVKSVGAELCSFYDKAAGHEYIWEGDPKFWDGTSPLLFPIVGRLRDDVYHLNGKEYKMPKHGFAKKMEFEVEVQTADELVFLLRDT